MSGGDPWRDPHLVQRQSPAVEPSRSPAEPEGVPTVVTIIGRSGQQRLIVVGHQDPPSGSSSRSQRPTMVVARPRSPRMSRARACAQPVRRSASTATRSGSGSRLGTERVRPLDARRGHRPPRGVAPSVRACRGTGRRGRRGSEPPAARGPPRGLGGPGAGPTRPHRQRAQRSRWSAGQHRGRGPRVSLRADGPPLPEEHPVAEAADAEHLLGR